jgi:hypothetical protein
VVVEEIYLLERQWKPSVPVYEVVATGRHADARRRRRDGIEFELGFL